MIVAQHLIDRVGGKLKAQQELNTPGWLMFNSGGVEIEVGEFLYGLVRAVKPKYVLETGTNLGISAAFMGLALEQNCRGLLKTLEINSDHSREAEQMLSRAGLSAWVHCIVADARTWEWGGAPIAYDMILLDTELQYRFANMVRLWSALKPGGWLIIHDLHVHMAQVEGQDNHGYGELPDEIVGWIRDHELQSFHFRTPRGLYVAQKRAPDFHTTKVLDNV